MASTRSRSSLAVAVVVALMALPVAAHSALETHQQFPEAGALLLFGYGLIGLVGYRRVRRMR